ncbi:hypothetical protein [Flavobacterium sp. ACAM 123]|uniref:hypothetical protein n=1 Tax=Flavobacterium sp. ACAM 123 TaxID=1189620 RepID=UPI0002F18A03|nr:hypothetical protein [Flavobacterium sp. ACAM 123]
MQKDRFFNYEIELPSIEAQKEILKQLNFLSDKKGELTSELTHQLDLIKQLRQSFLREAIQGKLLAKAENTNITIPPAKAGGYLLNDNTTFSANEIIWNGLKPIPNDSNPIGFSQPGQQLLEKIKAEKAQLIADKKIKKEKPLAPISEEEIPFEIPEPRAWCRLGELFSVEKGLIGIQKAISGKIPLVVTSENRLSHNEVHFKGKGVIVPLVSSTGHGHASLKRIHYQEGEFAVGNILACIMPLFPEYFNMKFIFNYLDSFKELFFVEKMKGAANVTLKISTIKETPIPLIPIEVQDKYEELIITCEGLERRIKQSQGHNEMLLQQLLREALQGEALQGEEV